MEELYCSKKIYKAGCITLDGRMDEAVWDEVPTYSDFTLLQSHGGGLQKEKTYFKIIPCEDRIYIGAKCMEPEEMATCIERAPLHNLHNYNAQSITLYFSPTGDTFEDYQFFIGWFGQRMTNFYSEKGTIEPDRYAPDWQAEVYTGEDYWSLEAEIPLTAFYMTSHDKWSDKWLLNVCRTRINHIHSSWCPVMFGFNSLDDFRTMDGFPVRPVEDDVRISSATAELDDLTDEGYQGIMTVKTLNAVDGEFDFISDHGKTTRVSLKAGENEFTVPCTFAETGLGQECLALKRVSDGKVFKRHYPVRTTYEPLKVVLTTPEYRNNFYPGQDYSKVVGKAISKKPVTLKLEGPGIRTQIITPEADGTFTFDTSDFEIGEAWLTGTIDGFEVKKKIRHLAPTGHTMTWISDGKMVCDGEIVLPRFMYATTYLTSKVFDDKYFSEEQYNTKKFTKYISLQPETLIKGCGGAGGEITVDGMPSAAMREAVDKCIETLKDVDFGCYYIGDEPECRAVSPVYLKNLFEYIADKDPYHAIMMSSRDPVPYIEGADWFQAHPYIIPYDHEDGRRTYTRPNHMVGSYIDAVVRLNRPDKCIGFLPTCFAYKIASANFDFPTMDEYLLNTWGALIHGAKSLWPYVYRDLNDRAAMYEGNKYLFSSVAALEDILLFGKRTQLCYSQLAEAVLFEHKDEKVLVVVNYTQEPQTVTVDGIEGEWYGFRLNRKLSGNTFTLHPLETLICTSTVRDAGLPSYDEVVASIAEQEYERTHTGNLLFEKQDDIKITCTGQPGYYTLSPYKLFDGVRNNRGVTMTRKEEDIFFEMNLQKVNVTFNKLTVYGVNLDGMTVQVRNGGELTTPAIADVIIEESCVTYLFKEAITPECLRLEFTQQVVQLFEIEVF